MSEDDIILRNNRLSKKKNSLAVLPVHGKNSIFVNEELDLTRNRGTAVQKKLDVLQ